MWVDPALFAKQIAAAGYQARKDDVRLTLRGTVKKEGKHLLLAVADVKPGPQVFVLQAAASNDAREKEVFGAAYGQLAKYAGQAVEVEGFWQAPVKKGERAALLVRGVKVGASARK